MVTKIDISNFGPFKDFFWNSNISENFADRNIIYGRNYSGKTTLSRIFRCVETKTLHEDFQNAKFKLTLKDGSTINETQLNQTDINIRVYNSDFRKDNLSFLFDKSGEIKPFTILGEKNIEIEKDINDKNTKLKIIQEKLGNAETPNGLLYQYKKLKNTIKKCEDEINKKLRAEASKIKLDTNLFKATDHKKQYNINDIQREIKNTKKISIEEKQKLKGILKEETKAQITVLKDFIYDFQIILNETKKILLREVRPSKSIKYLLNNAQLQDWVRQGIEHHRNKIDFCGFCRRPLPVEHWERLDAHFTKEVEAYKKQINILIQNLNIKINTIESCILPNKDQFYIELQEEYNELMNEWNTLKAQYIKNLKITLNVLETRSADVFKLNTLDEPTLKDVTAEMKDCIRNFNNIINANNIHSESFLTRKSEAREILRLDKISNFVDTIDYKHTLQEISHKKTEVSKLEQEISKQNNTHSEITHKIEKL
ncbi:MAG: AAA family ATPase, partial [Clostridia bacterium]|nr:AAA family ATPase [Clostridia bacterium]